MNLREKISLKEDNRGVSPVIGVIMMIAIVVIIAAVVAAFAYGIIGGVNKAPSSAMVVEGANPNDNALNVTLYHHGGDPITDAFNDINDANNASIADRWHNIELRLNGAKVNNSGTAKAEGLWMNDKEYNSTEWPSTKFAPGDQITVKFPSLKSGDTLVILHVPSDSILQRVTVT